MHRHWRRVLIGGLAAGLGLGALTACQGSLIYPAPRYPDGIREHLPRQVSPLPYSTDQGQQTAWILAHDDPTQVRTWWVVFGGNGMTALSWHDLLRPLADRGIGFLLVDYPGYGANAGSATPGRILRAGEDAVGALALRLGTTPGILGPRLGIVGHSLGAAAALQHAAAHPCRRVVLSAPFTSMVAMGHRALFWPCGYLVWHRFDNEDRLTEIQHQASPPAVLVLHGTEDRLIPLAMGRRLAADHPGLVTLVEVAGADHQSILRELPGHLQP